MIYIEVILWSYFLILPIYVFFTFEKEKEKLIHNPSFRTKYYHSIILFLWLPTLVLMTLIYFDAHSLNSIGLRWEFGLANQVAVVLTLLLSVYIWFSIKQIHKNKKAKETFLEQIECGAYLMPINVKEVRWFIGVCISAGICEEILFRGYLMSVFGEHMPVYAAVILSSIVFGLPHIYQGAVNVIKTGFFGAVMAVIYLVTESIIIPIVLHILVDMYFGIMFYTIHSGPNEKHETPNVQITN